MTWLTWRLSRLETTIALVAVAIILGFVVWNGLVVSRAFDAAGLPACVARQADDQACLESASDFLGRYDDIRGIKLVALICLPFFIGMLLAAPAIGELEHGTVRLAWTQSVTRRRWLAAKCGYGLAVIVAIFALLVPVWTWWRAPFVDLNGPFNSNSFDFEGTVPVAFAIFAFALCLALGVFLRHTIAALVIGFIGFLVTRAVVADQIRPRWMTPRRLEWEPAESIPGVSSPALGQHDWLIREGFLTSSGDRIPGSNPIWRTCVTEAEAKSGDLLERCLQNQGLRHYVEYHPADRFWIFQAIETLLYLGLAAALLSAVYWRVMRTR